MSASAMAARLGVQRGWREFLQSLRSPESGYYVILTAITIWLIMANRSSEASGTSISLAALMLPGMLAMLVFLSGTYGLAALVATQREEGTLLRMKSIPHGMTGLVVGHVVRTSIEVLLAMVIILSASMLAVPEVRVIGVSGIAVSLLAILAGLLAAIPLGLAIGAMFPNPRAVSGWGMLILMGLLAVSGVFAPIGVLPGWLQVVGQLFPLYWLGLAMRHTLLPPEAVGAEIGQSWRTLETVGVLSLWAVVGLVLAWVLLRKVARNESGSQIERRRQTALNRV